MEGISDPVRLVFAKGTPNERSIWVRFLVVELAAVMFRLIIAKNVLKKIGGYVDPATNRFCYRPDPADLKRIHGIPVRTEVPPAEVDINMAAYLHEVVAVAQLEVHPADAELLSQVDTTSAEVE